MKQNQPAPKTIPFCINCGNFIPADIGIPNDDPRCKKFPMVDIVDGHQFFVACHAARGQGAPCGGEGLMFTPKHPTPTAVEPDAQGLN